MVKLALVQMAVKGGEKDINVSHALEMVENAAQASSDIVVLPETCDLGWTDNAARTQAEAAPLGYPAISLCEAAKHHGVFICAGITEKDVGQVFNTAVLIGPEGEILLKHRKIYELDIAHDLYGLGQSLNVVQTPVGTIGIMTCADGFARGQAIARTLGYMGADIILSPCAWAVPAEHDNEKEPYGDLWRENYKPVAKDFSIWIVGVSNVGWIRSGPWEGRKCIGCSLVIDPQGNEVLQGPYGPDAETILYVDAKLMDRPARGTQWDM